VGLISKISQYPQISSPPTSMIMLGTDITDTTEAPSGTTKTTTIAQLVAAAGGGGGGGGVSGWKNLISDYGADPTGATPASTAIANACAAATAAQPKAFGLIVPPGIYEVTASQDLPYNLVIWGAGASGGDVTGQYIGSVFRLGTAFTGTYAFGFKDTPHVTGMTGTNGAVVSGIYVDGGLYTGGLAIDGFYIYGPTMCVFQNIKIARMTGWAVNASGVDSAMNEQFPFGQTWTGVAADSCGTVSGGGFNLVGCEDSVFTGCYSIGSSNGPGFLVNGCDNSKFVGCNSEWNNSLTSGYGFYVTGDWQYFTGGCTFTGCSTDSNGTAGFYCDATWTTGGGAGTGPGIIHVTGCHFRRDGCTNNPAISAGIYIGATTLPMIFSGFSTMPSIGDSGGTVYAPKYGVYLANASYAQPIVFSAGLAWGVTNGAYTHTAAGWPANSAVFSQTGVLLTHGDNSAPTYGS